MKHDIECSFEPDIVWLGEINRQVLRLEREAGLSAPGDTHLNCVLRQGGGRPAGVILTLRVGKERLSSFAEDPSPVAATRRAFDKLRASLEAHAGARLREEFRARADAARRVGKFPVFHKQGGESHVKTEGAERTAGYDTDEHAAGRRPEGGAREARAVVPFTGGGQPVLVHAPLQ